MDVTIHKQIEVLEKVLPEWELLQEKFHEITIFQSIEWLRSWWSHEIVRNKRATPYIVVIKNQSQIAGIIPLYITEHLFAGVRFRMLRPIGIAEANYLTPLLSKDFLPATLLQKAMDKIYEDKKSWDFIHWGELPEESNVDRFFKSKIKEENKLLYKGINTISPRLLFSEDKTSFEENVNKRFMKDIHSAKRKLEKGGDLQFYKVKEESEIEPIMNRLFTLHRERWKGKGTPSQFEKKVAREHDLKLAKDLFHSNLLYLVYLSYNNDIIAVNFGMSDNNTNWLYVHAFDRGYRKYSLGHLLAHYIIQHSLESNYKIVDFLVGGENDYKQKWGTINKVNVEYFIYNDSLKSLLYRLIKNTYYSRDFSKGPVIKQMPIKSFVRGCTFLFSIKEKFRRAPSGNVS